MQESTLSVSPAQAAVRLALPGMAAMTASSLCALLDALLLARRGVETSAAVSASLPLLSVIQTIGFALGTGAGSHVSRSLGRGNRASAAQAAQAAFWLSLLLSVPLCAAGLLFRAPLLALLGAASQPAFVYAGFLLVSGPLLCVNLVLSSLLRGLGRMGAYMRAYVLGALAGAALQLALIGRMGVSGSGAAMLAREGLTLFLLLRAAKGEKPCIFPSLRGMMPAPHAVSDIMVSGLPVLVRQGLASIAAAVSSRAASGFGAATLAGTGLAARAVMLVTSAVIGFCQGFQPVCGHAAGRGDMKNAQQTGCALIRYVVFALTALGAAVCLSAPALLRLFSSRRRGAWRRRKISPGAERRVLCAGRRHRRHHAHAGARHDRARQHRRRQQAGLYPPAASADSAAPLRAHGAAAVPERQRCAVTHPLPVHRGAGDQMFLVRTVRIFGCSESVSMIST